MLFLNEKRSRGVDSSLKPSEFAKKYGLEWSNTADEVKVKYNKEAEMLLEEYREKMRERDAANRSRKPIVWDDADERKCQERYRKKYSAH